MRPKFARPEKCAGVEEARERAAARNKTGILPFFPAKMRTLLIWETEIQKPGAMPLFPPPVGSGKGLPVSFSPTALYPSQILSPAPDFFARPEYQFASAPETFASPQGQFWRAPHKTHTDLFSRPQNQCRYPRGPNPDAHVSPTSHSPAPNFPSPPKTISLPQNHRGPIILRAWCIG